MNRFYWIALAMFVLHVLWTEGNEERRMRKEMDNPTPDDERGESQEAIKAQEKLRK